MANSNHLPFVSRKQSLELGLKYYFSKKPCFRGHTSKRYVSTGQCCKCNGIWHKNNPNKRPRHQTDKTRETYRLYVKNNRKKILAWRRGYMKIHRKKSSIRFKIRAHAAVHRAIKSGKLKRLPCEICKAPYAEAHHEDYSKQLDVRWLCRKCHMDYHQKSKDKLTMKGNA